MYQAQVLGVPCGRNGLRPKKWALSEGNNSIVAKTVRFHPGLKIVCIEVYWAHTPFSPTIPLGTTGKWIVNVTIISFNYLNNRSLGTYWYLQKCVLPLLVLYRSFICEKIFK